MTELTPKLAPDLVAACTAHASECAAALTRAFDAEYALGHVEAGDERGDTTSTRPDGPGLLILLRTGSSGLAAWLAESSGLLPAWCSAPDATGKEKLATLARELGPLVVPASIALDAAEARWVESLSAALSSGRIADDAGLVTLEISRGEQSAQLSLVWPLASPATTFDAAPRGPSSEEPSAQTPKKAGSSHSVSQLPHYSRSLLKIQLPVSVQLAGKKETVKEVVELVPGSIIKFDKGCDELLQMVIGGQSVAEGEAVKIGDKFGFRVTGLLLPREHFVPVKRPRIGDPPPPGVKQPQAQGV